MKTLIRKWFIRYWELLGLFCCVVGLFQVGKFYAINISVFNHTAHNSLGMTLHFLGEYLLFVILATILSVVINYLILKWQGKR